MIIDAEPEEMWYAIPNDLIGGWAVANRQANMAVLILTKEDYVIADMMSKHDADFVADMLNKSDFKREK